MKYFLLICLICSCDFNGRHPASVTSCVELLSKISNMIVGVEKTGDSALARFKVASAEFEMNLGDPQEMIDANNDLLLFMQTFYKDLGIETEVVETTITHKGVEIRFNRLDLIAGNNVISRAKEGLGVQKVTFDMIENILGKTGGFHRASDGLVSLKATRFWDEIDYQTLTGAMKHELSHAQFEKARRRGIRSIYSNSYHAVGDAKVGSGNYENYMSAEELYNYVGDPYGILHSLDWYDGYRQDLLDDLGRIKNRLESVEIHANDVKEIATSFSTEIEKLKKEQLYLIKYRAKIDGDYIVIYDGKSRYLKSFIDNEKKEIAAKYKELSAKYISPFDWTDSLNLQNAKFGERLRTVFRELPNMFSTLKEQTQVGVDLKAAYLKLLEEVQTEQQKLIRVAQNVIPQRDKSLDLLRDVMSDPDITYNSESFIALRRELRVLANMPREYYVGFVGN